MKQEEKIIAAIQRLGDLVIYLSVGCHHSIGEDSIKEIIREVKLINALVEGPKHKGKE